MKSFIRNLAIVFCLWTLIAVAEATNAYVISRGYGHHPAFWAALRGPLIEHWIWTALTPLVFLITHRFPFTKPTLLRSIVVHAIAFPSLSFLHCAIAQQLNSPLDVPEGYHGSLLLQRWMVEFYSDIWMYWPLVCIQALIESRARLIERETLTAQLETRLATSRLALLRAQIQPHFLFNTLHSISALLRVDTRAAEDMVADLAAILRAAYSDTVSQETSLGQELELVRCYLRIQQCRLGERLRIEERIGLDVEAAAIPTLLLQSLVENAVIHGASPIYEPVTLTIEARREADRLVMRVADDGAGLPAEFEPGVGLSNTRTRLQQLYGAAQSFDIVGAPGRGTTVTAELPYRPHQAAHQAAHQDEHQTEITLPEATDENPHPDRGRRAAGTPQSVVAAGS
jgi:two-component sensor histidine kinase